MFMMFLRDTKAWMKHGCAIISLVALAVFIWKMDTPNLQAAGNLNENHPEATETLVSYETNDELDVSGIAAPTWKQLEQFESVEVIATGYSAGYESTGKNPGHPQYGITYSGIQVKRGHLSTIAADPNVFPLGTILWIPGYGYGIVADTGSAIKGNKIDLYFETKEDVYRLWGKKNVRVYVIEKGKGEVTEAHFNEQLKRYSG